MNIDMINSYLNNILWLDFELSGTGINEVRLHGFIDEAEEDKIIIKFNWVFMISALTSFTYEGSGDFITVAEGETARSINIKYGVTQGNNIYFLSNTNVEGAMFIIAKDIEVIFCDKQ